LEDNHDEPDIKDTQISGRMNEKNLMQIVQNIVFVKNPFQNSDHVMIGCDTNTEDFSKGIPDSKNSKRQKMPKKQKIYLEPTTPDSEKSKHKLKHKRSLSDIKDHTTNTEDKFNITIHNINKKESGCGSNQGSGNTELCLIKKLFPPPKIEVIDYRNLPQSTQNLNTNNDVNNGNNSDENDNQNFQPMNDNNIDNENEISVLILPESDLPVRVDSANNNNLEVIVSEENNTSIAIQQENNQEHCEANQSNQNDITTISLSQIKIE